MTGFAVLAGDLIMSSLSEIRKLVSSYLVRDKDISAFAGDFAALFCDIEDCGDQEAIRFSYSIESELAKHAEGLFDESVLRNGLIACLQADVSQATVYSLLLVEPLRDEGQNCGTSWSQAEPIQVLTAV
jgi:hypothetical protein